MTFGKSFKTALKGLYTNKSRSVLTMLGIIIGVTSIILIMSLGEGAQNLILGEIQSIGSKTIAVSPGRQPTGPTDVISTFTDSLKEKDLEALKKKTNVPHLAKIMPVVFGADTAAYGNETYRPTIFGVTDMFSQIYGIFPSVGRLFTEEEIKSYADVALIGNKVKEELFGNVDAESILDKKIKIKGRNFKIIGVFGEKGQVSFVNFDDAAVVPYTTAQQYIFGIKYYHRLVVEADEEINVGRTVEDVKATIRNSHSITDPEKDDFFVETQADAMEMVGTVLNVLKLFLSSIAAISLVVGGIGIMNIMLVSVTERTKEIGLRKALGATDKDVLTQFLLESVTLTASGGVIGIVLGGILNFISSLVLSSALTADWGFALPVSSVLLGIGVSTFVGLIFGIYPARRAAKLDPIVALRYE